ncbi:MAG: M15 family metallopeptidase [Psychromonas sp.]|nr:M15 family metallopeptidase [Psychromonas sp.]
MLAEQLTGQIRSHLSEIKNNIFIHSDAVTDFYGLQNTAKKAGFNLQIASGFRSFERQLSIWNNKYTGKLAVLDKNEQPLNLLKLSELEKLYAILHWSALPGASRHHWGTDFDIFDPDLLPSKQHLQLSVREYCDGGYFQELSNWLSENMALFGFFRPYQSFLGGVAVEPWHISYYPIADEALKQLKQNIIYELISKQNILGRSLVCQQLPMIYEQFICNINQQNIGNDHVR